MQNMNKNQYDSNEKIRTPLFPPMQVGTNYQIRENLGRPNVPINNVSNEQLNHRMPYQPLNPMSPNRALYQNPNNSQQFQQPQMHQISNKMQNVSLNNEVAENINVPNRYDPNIQMNTNTGPPVNTNWTPQRPSSHGLNQFPNSQSHPPNQQFMRPNFQGNINANIQNGQQYRPNNDMYSPQPHLPTISSSQSPARKLDPDAVPSAINVIDENRKNHKDPFNTSLLGVLPPRITTHFISTDNGVSSPKYVRSTMYNVPATSNLLNISKVPFALSIVPMAELSRGEFDPPVVGTGENGPVRCRCKSYMCPFMKFVDGGRKYSCPFCNSLNDVPNEDFAYLDYTGRRVDASQKAQFSLGTFEYTATSQYCINNQLPQPPVYIFMIDVSFRTGAVNIIDIISKRLKNEVLAMLPVEGDNEYSKIQIGLATYSDTIHFINMNPKLSRPQIVVVTDLEDGFLPSSENFFVSPHEAIEKIDYVFEYLKTLYSEHRDSKVMLGPVIQAGIDALKSTNRVGKLIIVHTSLPNLQAPGQLKFRETKSSTTDKVALAPQTDYYSKLALKCVEVGCSVDMYLCTMYASVDIATLSDIVSKTSGKLYYYSDFTLNGDGGDRLINDLKENVSQVCAFNSILRVRTSIGIRAVDFWGNFTMANSNDVQIPCMSPNDGVMTEIKFDDTINAEQPIYIQVAFLYTSIGGNRRIRLMNLRLQPTLQLIDVYKSCDLDTIIALYSKKAVYKIFNSTPVQIREMLIDSCVYTLTAYRKHVSTTSAAGQLILPETMKLYPLYINCIMKSPAFINIPGSSIDNRSLAMFKLKSMTVKQCQQFLYPALMRIDTMSQQCIRLSSDRIESTGAYILDNGIDIILWIGLEISPNWLYDIFSVNSVGQIDSNEKLLPVKDNQNSIYLRNFIYGITQMRGNSLNFNIVKEKGENELQFTRYLFEDQGPLATSSYIDFLCQIHKQIRDKLKN